ncbi:MAG: MerR family transcriptional regulator [Alphaproteobacteria bacterium]|nr:MerR family transcriptional regulator [Alphaproteobacteria bacterium]
MVDPGDTPIVFAEYQFTLAEAAALSGVAEKTIRNWLAREVLKIGKRHILGRWLFNVIDLVRLAVMNDLTQQIAMPPAEASQIANAQGITDIVGRMTMRDESGQLLESADGYRPNINFLVAFHEGELVGFAVNIKTPGNLYPPHHGDVANAALRRAHVVIPIYATVGDLIFRIEELIRERQASEE